MDRELLGRVAALTPGQQRWLRTVLQSVFTMEAPAKRRAKDEPAERPRRARKRPAERKPTEEPRRRGLDELLRGEGDTEEEYPELANEIEGIGDIADLLREGGRERRRFGEELMRLFEAGDESAGDGEEDEGEDESAGEDEDEQEGRARFN